MIGCKVIKEDRINREENKIIGESWFIVFKV
jgi:hypothetical protein